MGNAIQKSGVRFLLFVVAAGSGVRAHAGSTNWSINLDNVGSTFTASETTYSTTMSGSFSRPASGYTVLTVGASSGTYAPSVGATLTTVEVPGLALFSQPIATNETQVVNMVVTGNCQTTDYYGLFVFTQWDQSGANNFESNYQPAFGTFQWTNATNTGTINQVFDPVDGNPISNFTPFSITGTCASGKTVVSGVGDRGGTLYMSSQGGAVFRTNGNKAILMMPQGSVSNTSELIGNYTAFYFESGLYGTMGTNGVNGSAITEPFRLSIANWGTSAAGSAVNPVTDSTLSDSASFTIDQIDSPVVGALRGHFTKDTLGGTTVFCGIYYTSRAVLVCTGQTPGNTSKPMNLVLVQDAVTTFTVKNGLTNGIVNSAVPAIDSPNLGKFYVGGEMTNLQGMSQHYIARLDAHGNIDPTFGYTGAGLNGPVAWVRPAIDSPNLGKIYVGGSFSLYGTASIGTVARLFSDGSLDTSFAVPYESPNNVVYAVEPASDAANLGSVYVGGPFQIFASVTVNNVMRLRSDGSLDTAFKALASGDPDFVNSISAANDAGNAGKIYVGGSLTTYGGASVSNLMRLLTNGALDTAFQNNLGTGFNNEVNMVKAAITSSEVGKVYVSGYFTAVNGYTLEGLARLLSDGHVDTTFTPNINYTVFGIQEAIDPVNLGKIYVSGDFNAVDNQYQFNLVRLYTNGRADPGFYSAGQTTQFSANQAPDTIAVATDSAHLGNVLIAGSFEQMGVTYPFTPGPATWTGGAVVLNSAGSIDPAFVPNVSPGIGFDLNVNSIDPAVDPANLGRVYVGGEFVAYESYFTSGGIARLNSTGTNDNTFNIVGLGFNPFASVYQVRVCNVPALSGRLYAVGDFYSYNSTSVSGIVRILPSGELDTSFALVGNGLYGTAYTVSEVTTGTGAGKVYVGGYIWNYPSYTRNHLIRYNSDGSLDASFGQSGSGFDNLVYAIQPVPDNSGRIYVGGAFSTYNGTSHQGIARVNSDGTLDASFVSQGFSNFNESTFVHAIAPALDSGNAGKIYVGGYFQSYGGVSRQFLMRLNSDGTLDPSFGTTSGFNNQIISILPGTSADVGKLYVSGWFHNYQNNVQPYLVRLLSDGSFDSTFAQGRGPNYAVQDMRYPTDPMAQPGSFYLGGWFNAYNDSVYGRHILRLLSNGGIN